MHIDRELVHCLIGRMQVNVLIEACCSSQKLTLYAVYPAVYTTLYWSQSSASAWKTSVPEAIKILQGTLHVNLNRWYRAELISKWHKTEINFWWRTWVERWKMAIFSFPHTEKQINIFTEINHLQKFLQLFTQQSWTFGIDKYLWCALWHFIYDMQDKKKK